MRQLAAATPSDSATAAAYTLRLLATRIAHLTNEIDDIEQSGELPRLGRGGRVMVTASPRGIDAGSAELAGMGLQNVLR
jgi:hypothetical protein